MSSRKRFKIERARFPAILGDSSDSLIDEVNSINDQIKELQTRLGIPTLNDEYIKNYIGETSLNPDNRSILLLFDFIQNRMNVLESVINNFIVQEDDEECTDEIVIECPVRIKKSLTIE